MDDIYSSLNFQRCIKPVAIGTTGTGQTGKVIDRKGYIGPVVFACHFGEITSTAAAFTVTVREGDVTGTMTSAADADLIGTEAAAAPGTGARVSGTTKNVVKKIGYKGAKRYCQVNIRSTVTAGTPVAADAVQRAASQPAA